VEMARHSCNTLILKMLQRRFEVAGAPGQQLSCKGDT
jgi:hypothetical protein